MDNPLSGLLCGLMQHEQRPLDEPAQPPPPPPPVHRELQLPTQVVLRPQKPVSRRQPPVAVARRRPAALQTDNPRVDRTALPRFDRPLPIRPAPPPLQTQGRWQQSDGGKQSVEVGRGPSTDNKWHNASAGLPEEESPPHSPAVRALRAALGTPTVSPRRRCCSPPSDARLPAISERSASVEAFGGRGDGRTGFDCLARSLARALKRAAPRHSGYDARWRLVSTYLEQYGLDYDNDVAEMLAEAAGLLHRPADSPAVALAATDALFYAAGHRLPEMRALVSAARLRLQRSIFVDPVPRAEAPLWDRGWEQSAPPDLTPAVVAAGTERLGSFSGHDTFKDRFHSGLGTWQRRLKYGFMHKAVGAIIDRWRDYACALLLCGWRVHQRRAKTVATLSKAKEHLENRLRQMGDLLEKKHAEIQQVNVQHSRTAANLRAERDAARDEVTELTEKLKEAKAAAVQLRGEVEVLRAQRQEREIEIDVARAERGELDRLLQNETADEVNGRNRQLQLRAVALLTAGRQARQGLASIVADWVNRTNSGRSGTPDSSSRRGLVDGDEPPPPPHVDAGFESPLDEATASYHLVYSIAPEVVSAADVISFRTIADPEEQARRVLAAAAKLKVAADYSAREYLAATAEGGAVRRRVLVGMMGKVLDAAVPEPDDLSQRFSPASPLSGSPPMTPDNADVSPPRSPAPNAEPATLQPLQPLQPLGPVQGLVARRLSGAPSATVAGVSVRSASVVPLPTSRTESGDQRRRGTATSRSRYVLRSPVSSPRVQRDAASQPDDDEEPSVHPVLPDGAVAPWEWRDRLHSAREQRRSLRDARSAIEDLVLQDIAEATREAARRTPEDGTRAAAPFIAACGRLADLHEAVGEDAAGGRQRLELALREMGQRLQDIYRYYSSTDKRAVSTVMSRAELERLLQDARAFDQPRRARGSMFSPTSPASPASPRRVTWLQDIHKVCPGLGDALMRDRVNPPEFVEVLCRVACMLPSQGTVAARLRWLFDKHLVANVSWAVLDDFRTAVGAEDTQAVIAEYRPLMLSVFTSYATVDRDQRHCLLFRDFKKLMDDLKTVDEVCTHYALQQMFLKLQGLATDAEDVKCDFPDFITLICCVAVFKNPAPYLPVHQKVRFFIRTWLSLQASGPRRGTRFSVSSPRGS